LKPQSKYPKIISGALSKHHHGRHGQSTERCGGRCKPGFNTQTMEFKGKSTGNHGVLFGINIEFTPNIWV